MSNYTDTLALIEAYGDEHEGEAIQAGAALELFSGHPTLHSAMSYETAYGHAARLYAAKDDVEDWETISTFVSTYADHDGEKETQGACDVEVQIGHLPVISYQGEVLFDPETWFLRTTDDAGGSDDCDATVYHTREQAVTAAKVYAEDHDESEGTNAETFLAAERDGSINEGKDQDGEYALLDSGDANRAARGTRWDADRYSDRDAAELAIARWYDRTREANPGTGILFRCMDCPVLGKITEANRWEIVADEA